MCPSHSGSVFVVAAAAVVVVVPAAGSVSSTAASTTTAAQRTTTSPVNSMSRSVARAFGAIINPSELTHNDLIEIMRRAEKRDGEMSSRPTAPAAAAGSAGAAASAAPPPLSASTKRLSSSGKLSLAFGRRGSLKRVQSVLSRSGERTGFTDVADQSPAQKLTSQAMSIDASQSHLVSPRPDLRLSPGRPGE